MLKKYADNNFSFERPSGELGLWNIGMAKYNLEQLGWKLGPDNKKDFNIIKMLYALANQHPERRDAVANIVNERFYRKRVFNISEMDEAYEGLYNDLKSKFGKQAEDVCYYIEAHRKALAPKVAENKKMIKDVASIRPVIDMIAELKPFNVGNLPYSRSRFSRKGEVDLNSIRVNDYLTISKGFEDTFGKFLKYQNVIGGDDFSKGITVDFISKHFKVNIKGQKKQTEIKKIVEDATKSIKGDKELIERTKRAYAMGYVLQCFQDEDMTLYFEPSINKKSQYKFTDTAGKYLNLKEKPALDNSVIESKYLDHNKYADDADENDLNAFRKDNNLKADLKKAFDKEQVIEINNPEKKIGKKTVAQFKEKMIANGWSVSKNPFEENMIITLFDLYDIDKPYAKVMGTQLDKLYNTKIQGLVDRNKLIRR